MKKKLNIPHKIRISIYLNGSFYLIGNNISQKKQNHVLTVEITCGSCGKLIKQMEMLRPIKDLLKKISNRCPSCGKLLSPNDFSVELEPK